MGFFSSIFGGKKYNNPGWMRDAGRGLFNRYGQMGEQLYGQAGRQRRNAHYSEDLDTQLANQDAAGYGDLAARGMRDSSNGGGLYGLTRSRDESAFRAGTEDWANQGELGLLQGQFGMLGGLQSLYSQYDDPGLFGQLGGALGSMGGMLTPHHAPAAGTPDMTHGGNFYTSGGGTVTPQGTDYADYFNNQMGVSTHTPQFGATVTAARAPRRRRRFFQ